MDFINHQLLIKDINVHIDPILPKKTAIITHGHADHARFGHDHVIATRQTIDIMKIRYGDKCAKKFTPLRYGQRYSIKNFDFTLYPAGHILGSAQVLIQKDNHRLVITGDYKVGKDETCKNFKLVKCDTLITEATFGLPIFQHPDPKDEIQKLIRSVKINKHNCHIVGAYALGKAQRVMNLLRQQNYNETIYIHGSLEKLCEYYSKEKINIGKFEKVSSKDKNFYEGKIIIAPPSALKDRWSRRNTKIKLLQDYFKTLDINRAYALAILSNQLSFQFIKASKLRGLVYEQVDQHLFDFSYDYVGDLAETISLIWPTKKDGKSQNLSTLIENIKKIKKSEINTEFSKILSQLSNNERWTLIKICTGGLRIGVSERLVKTALADLYNKNVNEIEEIWHGLEFPYENLFQWLKNETSKPKIDFKKLFHPMMLANPIDEEKDFKRLNASEFQAEYKWDGIRVQLMVSSKSVSLYSRTGDNISSAFPEIVENTKGDAVIDGELLVGRNFKTSSFNDLQQRLNRKKASKDLQEKFPVFIRAYDILFYKGKDLRKLFLYERRKYLEKFQKENKTNQIDLSLIIKFKTWKELTKYKNNVHDDLNEGVMIKLKNSEYLPGRKKGYWYKWKKNPKLVDAILMYAQRGHGKRSSYYSDFTFGVWKENELVPIGKAYSGYTDKELLVLDKFIRNNTTNKFGPVREVKKEIILEIAFDDVFPSSRHKSGVAMRFPRIHRIRWDKPTNEVLSIEEFKKEFKIS